MVLDEDDVAHLDICPRAPPQRPILQLLRRRVVLLVVGVPPRAVLDQLERHAGDDDDGERGGGRGHTVRVRDRRVRLQAGDHLRERRSDQE